MLHNPTSKGGVGWVGMGRFKSTIRLRKYAARLGRFLVWQCGGELWSSCKNHQLLVLRGSRRFLAVLYHCRGPWRCTSVSLIRPASWRPRVSKISFVVVALIATTVKQLNMSLFGGSHNWGMATRPSSLLLVMRHFVMLVSGERFSDSVIYCGTYFIFLTKDEKMVDKF